MRFNDAVEQITGGIFGHMPMLETELIEFKQDQYINKELWKQLEEEFRQIQKRKEYVDYDPYTPTRYYVTPKYQVNTGDFWFNPATQEVQIWSGQNWNQVKSTYFPAGTYTVNFNNVSYTNTIDHFTSYPSNNGTISQTWTFHTN